MTPVSPSAESASVTFVITAAGRAIDRSYQIVSVDTWNAANSIPRARMVLLDDAVAEGTGAVSSAETFAPGTAIEISAGYGGALTRIFSGTVIKYGIEIPQDAGSTVIVDAADAALAMTVARKTAVFHALTDRDLIGALIANYGNLSSDLSATPIVHEAIVQFDATDWDTIVTRAEMNGLVVITDTGTVTVRPPDASTSASLRVAYGESIMELRAEIDAAGSLSRVARPCGRVRFQGSALARTGEMLELAGLGDRFNGNVVVSAVHHTINAGVWQTTADFGLPSARQPQTSPATLAPASALLPAARGLHIGIVEQSHEDPSGAFRVLVRLPLAQDGSAGIWARLATFYASSGAGAAFYPEIGDEVIVGFMNEDPRAPIVLGSVYSPARPPAHPGDQERLKGITTRSKMEMTFDDTDKVVTIKTPGGHVVTLNDAAGSIRLEDSNQNAIVLGRHGVTIDSASNVDIRARGDISLLPQGNLAMKAVMNLTGEALHVELGAQNTLSVHGSAAAELKSSGVTTVTGALVRIN